MPTGKRADWRGRMREVTINASTMGDNTIIAAATGKTLRLYKIFFFVGTATDIILKSGSSTLVPVMSFGDKGTFVMEDTSEAGRHPFTLGEGEAFVMNLSAANQISGYCWYIQDAS